MCFSCSDIPDDSINPITELSLKQSSSGTIATEGEVDWYHYRAIEANNIMQVNCFSNTYRPDVDLLVTVFEVDDSGNKVRMLADHAPEDSQLPADIQMNIYIDSPKDIYISVRDLLDDEYSDNPYYLTIDFTGGADGNDNFTEAIALTVDDASSCRTDCIGTIGDVDCYSFSASVDGIYNILIDFNQFAGGTDVELSIDLYNSEGVLQESLSRPQGSSYNLLPFLTSGEYYILIDDYGKDDFDNASTYQICINSATTNEASVNDSIENASAMTYDNASCTYSISGSLDYMEDVDWYQFSLQNIETTGFKVLNIRFDDGEEEIGFNYQVNIINIQESTENPLLSHSFVGGSTEYQSQIKAAESGDHYLMIQASPGQTISQSAPYTVSIEVLDIEDQAEVNEKIVDPNTGETAIGNNTINTADELLPDTTTIGKIGYRGDEDWYYIEIEDTAEPQILEVFLDTNSETSYVEYYLSIIRDQLHMKAFDTIGEDGPTELKMSLLVPAIESGNPVHYFFKVCDYQGDDGDGLTEYRIRANLRDIPASLPSNPNINSSSVTYYKEDVEREDDSAVSIALEHNSLSEKEYKVNTTILKFNDPNDSNFQGEGISRIYDASTDLTTITFPWVAGYIDFQGDQDWFQIDMAPLFSDANVPLESDWYYDIQIELHTGNPGSPVEYVWKLYRDYDQDGELVDYERDSNGFMASAGDGDTDIQAFDIIAPNPGEEFWVGDAWKGKFYLSISDFNYISSEHPDDDWDYDYAPYHFKLTLIYHPGVSYP